MSEAQLRRVFFEEQLKDTKENLIKAERDLQRVQEKSGVIVLDKQAEALIGGAAQLRAQIAEREVQLQRAAQLGHRAEPRRAAAELRSCARCAASWRAWSRARAARAGSAVDMPVGKLPEAAIDYVRARRELKMQETLLESMLRQYEIAKLDEAKEGPVLQQVDVALPPDHKSKPSRALIVLAAHLRGAARVSACGRRAALLAHCRERGRPRERRPRLARACAGLALGAATPAARAAERQPPRQHAREHRRCRRCRR